MCAAGQKKDRKQRKEERKQRVAARKAERSGLEKVDLTADDIAKLTARPTAVGEAGEDSSSESGSEGSSSSGGETTEQPAQPAAAAAEGSAAPAEEEGGAGGEAVAGGVGEEDAAEVAALLKSENVEELGDEERDKLTQVGRGEVCVYGWMQGMAWRGCCASSLHSSHRPPDRACTAHLPPQLDGLTGQPRAEDILLFAIPVCAPYQVWAGGGASPGAAGAGGARWALGGGIREPPPCQHAIAGDVGLQAQGQNHPRHPEEGQGGAAGRRGAAARRRGVAARARPHPARVFGRRGEGHVRDV